MRDHEPVPYPILSDGEAVMSDAPESAYNYSTFEASLQEFHDFAVHAPKATMRAPSFPLESLTAGTTVEMSDLWAGHVAIIEFGSFT